MLEGSLPSPVAYSPLIDGAAPTEYKVYRRRWVMVLLYCTLIVANNVAWLTFSPIFDDACTYFGVSHTQINMLSIIFMIFGTPTSVLCSYVFHRWGTKTGLIIAGFANAAGCWIRCAASLPGSTSPGYAAYAWLVLGQCFCAFSQPFFSNSPSKISAEWFPHKERSIATTIGTMFNPVGMAIGQFLPPLFVSRGGVGMDKLLWVEAAISTGAVLLVLFFFREHPPSPPSRTSERKMVIRTNSLRKLKEKRLAKRESSSRSTVRTDRAHHLSQPIATPSTLSNSRVTEASSNRDDSLPSADPSPAAQGTLYLGTPQQVPPMALRTNAHQSATPSLDHDHDLVDVPISDNANGNTTHYPSLLHTGSGLGSVPDSDTPLLIAQRTPSAMSSTSLSAIDGTGEEEEHHDLESFDHVKQDIMRCLKNKQFLILTAGFGCGVAIFNALVTLIGQITSSCGYTSDQAGLFGVMLIGGGLTTAALAAPVLDRYQSKLNIFLKVFFGCSLCCGIYFFYALRPDNFALLAVAFTLWGSFALPILPISFECSAECTFPVNEDISGAILMCGGTGVGIGMVFALNFLIPDHYEGYFSHANIVVLAVMGVTIAIIMCYNGPYARQEYERQRMLLAKGHGGPTPTSREQSATDRDPTDMSSQHQPNQTDDSPTASSASSTSFDSNKWNKSNHVNPDKLLKSPPMAPNAHDSTISEDRIEIDLRYSSNDQTRARDYSVAFRANKAAAGQSHPLVHVNSSEMN